MEKLFSLNLLEVPGSGKNTDANSNANHTKSKAQNHFALPSQLIVRKI